MASRWTKRDRQNRGGEDASPLIALAATVAVAQAGMAFAQGGARIAPGESSVAVVNGRIHHAPKRYADPAYLAELKTRREAKAVSRLAARDARRHGVAVSNGRMTFTPKPAPTAFAITDQ